MLDTIQSTKYIYSEIKEDIRYYEQRSGNILARIRNETRKTSFETNLNYSVVKGYCNPKQKLACFVCYLQITYTFLKNYMRSLPNL